MSNYDDLLPYQKQHVDSLNQDAVAKAYELDMLPQNFQTTEQLEEGIVTFMKTNPAQAAKYFEKHPEEAEEFYRG